MFVNSRAFVSKDYFRERNGEIECVARESSQASLHFHRFKCTWNCWHCDDWFRSQTRAPAYLLKWNLTFARSSNARKLDRILTIILFLLSEKKLFSVLCKEKDCQFNCCISAFTICIYFMSLFNFPFGTIQIKLLNNRYIYVENVTNHQLLAHSRVEMLWVLFRKATSTSAGITSIRLEIV